jgi:hypothetical protein
MNEQKQIDACAIRILDLAQGGMYSYSNGNLTTKQKNLKRDVKKILTEWFSQESKKTAVKLILDALININVPTLLREENECLSKKVAIFEEKQENFKEVATSLYKNELREELRLQMDQDREEAIESSRRVNRKLMDHIKVMEDRLDSAKGRVSREQHDKLVDQNIQLNELIIQLREKTNLSKRAVEIEKILKLEKSSSEDSISEVMYDTS